MVDDADKIVTRLEAVIEDIDCQASKEDGGLHAVEGGNKLLAKALALHGLMTGEIDELHEVRGWVNEWVVNEWVGGGGGGGGEWVEWVVGVGGGSGESGDSDRPTDWCTGFN